MDVVQWKGPLTNAKSTTYDSISSYPQPISKLDQCNDSARLSTETFHAICLGGQHFFSGGLAMTQSSSTILIEEGLWCFRTLVQQACSGSSGSSFVDKFYEDDCAGVIAALNTARSYDFAHMHREASSYLDEAVSKFLGGASTCISDMLKIIFWLFDIVLSRNTSSAARSFLARLCEPHVQKASPLVARIASLTLMDGIVPYHSLTVYLRVIIDEIKVQKGCGSPLSWPWKLCLAKVLYLNEKVEPCSTLLTDMIRRWSSYSKFRSLEFQLNYTEQFIHILRSCRSVTTAIDLIRERCDLIERCTSQREKQNACSVSLNLMACCATTSGYYKFGYECAHEAWLLNCELYGPSSESAIFEVENMRRIKNRFAKKLDQEHSEDRDYIAKAENIVETDEACLTRSEADKLKHCTYIAKPDPPVALMDVSWRTSETNSVVLAENEPTSLMDTLDAAFIMERFRPYLAKKSSQTKDSSKAAMAVSDPNSPMDVD